MIRPGAIQRAHDLQCKKVPDPSCCPIADEDWLAIRMEPYHSYEARVTSGEVVWREASPNDERPDFSMVASNGSVLVYGQFFDAVGDRGLAAKWVVRGTAPAPGTRFLRARGTAEECPDTYDVEFLDTTLFVPRWLNSQAQSETTAFLIQNATDHAVSGYVNLFDGSGNILPGGEVPFTIAPRAVRSFHTAVEVPAAENAGGSATITHDGGWGALMGQAVRIQRDYGWAFHTPMETRPR